MGFVYFKIKDWLKPINDSKRLTILEDINPGFISVRCCSMVQNLVHDSKRLTILEDFKLVFIRVL